MYRYKGTVGVGAGGQAWWCFSMQAPLVGPGQQEYGTRVGKRLRAASHACIPLTTMWCTRVIGVSLASSYSFYQLGTSDLWSTCTRPSSLQVLGRALGLGSPRAGDLKLLGLYATVLGTETRGG